MGRLRSLEMLRALASLLVVLFHAEKLCALPGDRPVFGGLFAAGNRGVDLFFVLSGFIIALRHGADLGRPKKLPVYLFSRLVRIYPAVWIMTAFAIILYASGFEGADKEAKLAFRSIIASTLLLPQLGDALVNVTWTLKYEAFFYALFSICIVRPRFGFSILLVWQAATIWFTLSGADLSLATYYLRSICLEFGVGLICALLTMRGLRSPLVMTIALLATGAVAFIAGMALDKRITWAGMLCALGAGAVILSLVRLERSDRIRVPEPLVVLGGASYAIYIVHFSVITLLVALLQRLAITMTVPLAIGCIAIGISAGLLFDWLIDQPIQRFLRSYVPAHREPALAATE
jgi:exopolysaccharide production protein ExoZ